MPVPGRPSSAPLAPPRGWGDLLRQVVLFCGAYWLYRLVRGAVVEQPAAAFEHARELIALEQAVGLYVEPAIHRWASAHEWVADGAAWAYVNTHFVITSVTLAWLYLRRNDAFYFVRNMFVVAMALALAGYLAYPTAPPRLLPEAGFGDPVAALTGGESDGPLVNPYAAVPSMHVGFALLLAGAMWRLARARWVRAAWAAYPALVTFVVLATANHWWVDAALGAAAAALSALAAAALARRRPYTWSLVVPPATSRGISAAPITTWRRPRISMCRRHTFDPASWPGGAGIPGNTGGRHERDH